MAEIKIVREPKGGPDIIFIGTKDMEKRLLLAGDHLSVRGFTARVVILPDGVKSLSALPEAERARARAGGAPYISIMDREALSDADAATIASAALEAIQA